MKAQQPPSVLLLRAVYAVMTLRPDAYSDVPHQMEGLIVGISFTNLKRYAARLPA